MNHDDIRGFSMIETMVAVVIVSVALLAMGGMLIHTMQSNQNSEARMDAAAVSQAVLSDHAAQLLSGAWNGQAPATGTQGDYNYSVTASTNNGQTVLAVTLTPKSSGSRAKPFTNQTAVTTVAGLSTNDNYVPPASNGGSNNDGTDNGGKSTDNNGKSTDNNGKSTDNNGKSTDNNGKSTDNNGKDSGNGSGNSSDNSH